MRWILADLAALTLVLAGCGSQEASSGSPGPDAVGTGTVADLDFMGTTLDGTTFGGASLEGKPAALWF